MLCFKGKISLSLLFYKISHLLIHIYLKFSIIIKLGSIGKINVEVAGSKKGVNGVGDKMGMDL